MALDGALPRKFNAIPTTFTAANGTRCKIISDIAKPSILPSVAGEVALPGESAVRQRVLEGDQRIVDGLITSTDSVAKSVLLFIGQQLSVYENMGVVTTTATTNATITRTVGSFITDGWKVGSHAMLDGSLSAANDGNPVAVTAVTTTTLTLNGVSAVSVAETQGAGFRLFQVAQVTRIPIPANSGNSDAILPVRLIGNSNDPRGDNSGMMLGENEVLIMGMVAATSALPATIGVTVHRGKY